MSQYMPTINECLISLSTIKLDMPYEVAIAFNQQLTNKSFIESLRKMWFMGNHNQYAMLELMRPHSGYYTCVFRPSGVQFDIENKLIQIATPSRLLLNLYYEQFQTLVTEDIMDVLGDYLYIEFTSKFEIVKILPLRGNTDMQTAKHILTQTPPVDALAIGLGYDNSPIVIRSLLPRLASWFRVQGNPINVMQFTHANTGKTTYGLRSETLFNWEYINETPTLARLVFDARSGQMGTVHLRSGMVFDEIDKWKGTIDRFQTLLAVINTGLEQGRWTRGIATGGHSVTTSKFLPCVIFGNLPYEGLPTTGVRQNISRWLMAQTGVNMEQFVDRFGVIDVNRLQVNISGHLAYKVLPDNIMRGIVKIVQERIEYKDVSQLSGRMKFHSDRLYAILKALGYAFEPKQVDGITSGADAFDRYFMGEMR